MKKTGSVIMLALLSIMLAFSACTKKQEATEAAADPNAPVNLTIWAWNPRFNIFAINEATKIYQRKHPNVTVSPVEIEWGDVQQKLITALSSNQTDSLPDITCASDYAIVKNMTTYPNAFLPVDGIINLAEFAQFKVDAGKVNGKNYIVPFDSGTAGTFLRRDIVEQAGLKAEDFDNITWDRYIELGKIIKTKTGYPLISWSNNDPYILSMMLRSAGSWVLKDDGTPNFVDNDVLNKSIDIVRRLVSEGLVLLASDWNSYIASLNNGSVVSTINGIWIVASITAEPSQTGKWFMTNTPSLAGVPSSGNYTFQGGSSWAVLGNSKHPDVALDYLKETFASSVELYEIILPSAGAVGTWLPAVNSTAYHQSIDYFGGQKIYEEIMDYASRVPPVKYGVFSLEAQEALGRAMNEILQGKSVADALGTAQKNVSFLMGL
ncbi:MAG: ABC transporter substrate-binding protein [Treponema sp.]|jgi:lactose/L-arabinose transport system substrate-binding protein|nr:ABC transporter substrate-binding protein [Treponema sp.]